jgi:hypothetical protein
MSTPDWAKLKEIGSEIETLQEQGRWDRTAFDRLLGDAKEAVHGHEEFLEFVVNEAEQTWL